MSDMGQHETTGKAQNAGKRSRMNEASPSERGLTFPVSVDATGVDQFLARLELRLAALSARHDELVARMRASEHDLSTLEQRKETLGGPRDDS